MVFLCKVLGSLLSGMEARAFFRGDISKLEHWLARKAMGSMALAKNAKQDGKAHFRSIPNSEVRRMLRNASFATELRIRRLKWWQSLPAALRCMLRCSGPSSVSAVSKGGPPSATTDTSRSLPTLGPGSCWRV